MIERQVIYTFGLLVLGIIANVQDHDHHTMKDIEGGHHPATDIHIEIGHIPKKGDHDRDLGNQNHVILCKLFHDEIMNFILLPQMYFVTTLKISV